MPGFSSLIRSAWQLVMLTNVMLSTEPEYCAKNSDGTSPSVVRRARSASMVQLTKVAEALVSVRARVAPCAYWFLECALRSGNDRGIDRSRSCRTSRVRVVDV